MSSLSTFLLIPLIAQSQNNKEITFNTAIDQLDEAMNQKLADVTVLGADITITDVQATENIFFKFIGTPGAGLHIIVPNRGRMYLMQNANTSSPFSTLRVLTKTLSPPSYVDLSDNLVHLLYCDGNDNVLQVF